MNDRIADLQRQVRAEQDKINRCQHEFGDPFYNAEVKQEPYYQTVAHGSDVYPEVAGYREKRVDRWSKKCSKCGVVLHTYTQVPVITSYKPDFGK